jgi:hypothetical protein
LSPSLLFCVGWPLWAQYFFISYFSQLVKKFPAFYDYQKPAIRPYAHPKVSSPSTPSHFFNILVSLSSLLKCLPNSIFPLGFSTETAYICRFFSYVLHSPPNSSSFILTVWGLNFFYHFLHSQSVFIREDKTPIFKNV